VQLVILAAGRGRRFGGLKQLAPAGPNGESIMDYTARAAHACGFTGAVVIVPQDCGSEVEAHVARYWPKDFPVAFAVQPPRPGTAQAVLAAQPHIDGPFCVANADDLYGDQALGVLIDHAEGRGGPTGEPISPRDGHLLVAYQLLRTVLTSEPVTRGLIEVSPSHHLLGIHENTVVLREDGQFDSWLLGASESDILNRANARLLTGTERVSMNLWGFNPRIFAVLDAALETFDPTTHRRGELLLPEVVEQLIESGSDTVDVVDTDSRCIGLTHADDLPILQDELALAPRRQRPIRHS
jgi:hypothetical protein